MPSLKRILNATARDEHGEKRGDIADVTLNLASGKCAIRIGNADYSADKAAYAKKTLTLTNPQIITGTYIPVVGKSAYDAQGNYIGLITDVSCGTNLNLLRITCDNGASFTRRRVQGVNDIVIIKIPKPKTAKSTRKQQQKQEEQKQVTKQHSLAQNTAATAASTAFPARRRYGDFNFLIGKIVDKNITNFYNEVMIRRGSKITAATLKQAKASGKLIELCLHAK